MKISEASCKVVGVQLGEATISLLNSDGIRAAPLKAKFALMNKEEQASGYIEVRNWSQRTIDALLALQDAMEEDALAHLFDVSPGANPTKSKDEAEPPQF